MSLIGITMRVSLAAHNEVRDALAQDWSKFMQNFSTDWIPLPNRGSQITALAEHLQLSGLILSGGNSIGERQERDTTEIALLQWARERTIPVFGVCRGMELLQHFYGGELKLLDKKLHVSRHHTIRLDDGTIREVNSFHTLGVSSDMLAAELSAWAFCTEDGTVEALRAKHAPFCGILWHPEREAIPHAEDIALFRQHLHLA